MEAFVCYLSVSQESETSHQKANVTYLRFGTSQNLDTFIYEDSILHVRTSWENENRGSEHTEYSLIPQKCLWSFEVPVFF